MIKYLKIKTLKEITLYNSLKNNFSKLSELNYCDKEINHKIYQRQILQLFTENDYDTF